MPQPRFPTSTRPTRRRLARATLAAALLAAVSAMMVAGGSVDAAPPRATSTTVLCSPATITAGSTVTCRIKVTDVASGAKSVPGGTVLLTSAPADAITIGPACALAPFNSKTSHCEVELLLVSAGTRVLTAAYTPTDGVHAPSVSAPRNQMVNAAGSPVIFTPQSTTDGTVGDDLDIYGAGCLPNASAVEGEFVAEGQDPLTGGAFQPFETVTHSNGSFEWHVNIPPDNGIGVYYARWYCAAAPVTSLLDPALTWVSTPYVYTIHPAAPLAAARVTSQVDPDGLPSLDGVGIEGSQAAALKARVDTVVDDVAAVSRLYFAFTGAPAPRADIDQWVARLRQGTETTVIADTLAATSAFRSTYDALSNRRFVQAVYPNVLGRPATTAETTFWTTKLSEGTTRANVVWTLAGSDENVARTADTSYVAATYQELTTVTPTLADLDRFGRQLRDIDVRVSVVEDVALSRAPADFWMAGVDAGEAPRA